jgi:hypothetical protein
VADYPQQLVEQILQNQSEMNLLRSRLSGMSQSDPARAGLAARLASLEAATEQLKRDYNKVPGRKWMDRAAARTMSAASGHGSSEYDAEFMTPPGLDLATATKLGVLQSIGALPATAPVMQHDMMNLPPAHKVQTPNMMLLENLLRQPDLRRALQNMAKDLGYIVNLYVPMEYNTKITKELEELGITDGVKLMDPVVLVGHKLGVWASMAEGRTAIVQALKGLPEKAMKAVVEKLISLTLPPAADPNAWMGTELTAYQEFPIIGSLISGDLDIPSAPAVKPQPAVRIIGKPYGATFNPKEQMAVHFKVVRKIWNEKWRVEVLDAEGNFQVGLPGLNDWQGFVYQIPWDEDSGMISFTAPTLRGQYQARLMDEEGLRAKANFSVA